jgi:hypothetical protein
MQVLGAGAAFAEVGERVGEAGPAADFQEHFGERDAIGHLGDFEREVGVEAIGGLSVGAVQVSAELLERPLRCGVEVQADADLREYRRVTRFFGTQLLINVAVGVVTGLVQEFEFGMNWSQYSRFVGDVFGAPLAMEGLAAFFLESTFLGLWLFGWDRLPKRVHLASASGWWRQVRCSQRCSSWRRIPGCSIRSATLSALA